jgi:nucleoside-diphosphate-sugar epimerase
MEETSQNMKIFITGGTGFIGERLTEKLISEGKQVVLLVRDPAKSGIKEKPGITIIKGDLFDIPAIEEGISGCDLAYHLAAYTKPSASDPQISFRTNVEGTENILEAALKCKVPRIVVTSTGGTLSYSADGNPVDETAPVLTEYNTEYERTKALAEKVIRQYCERGLNVIVVNPTRIYGPGKLSVSNSVTRIIDWYLKGSWRFVPGNGNSIGNYVFIDDVVNGLQLAYLKGKPGERYILGGENLSFRQMFSIIGSVSGKNRFMIYLPAPLLRFVVRVLTFFARMTGRDAPITNAWLDKYLKNWIMSSDKAVRELDYTITPFSKGVAETIKWIRANRNSND